MSKFCHRLGGREFDGTVLTLLGDRFRAAGRSLFATIPTMRGSTDLMYLLTRAERLMSPACQSAPNCGNNSSS